MKILSIICVCVLVLGLAGFVLAKSDNAQTGDTEQNQNQNQEQNQGEDIQNQEQNQGQENEGEENSLQNGNQVQETKQLRINIEEHSSTVSTFIHQLEGIADNQGDGIGAQVRTIAQEQNQVREKIADEIESIQERNKIKTFLFGSNYKNLGALRSEMVQTRNRLEKLTGLMEQTTDEIDKTELQNQIQIMEQERLNIENFVKTNESRFSLFGWLVKLFNK
ncbi:MAG: hypothetical protein V1686_02315 [Patescibacteria group bacterium]